MRAEGLPVLVAVAWVATILASSAPHIVVTEAFHVRAPLTIGLIQIVVVTVLLGTTLLVDGLRPLAGYVLALLAYVVGNEIVQVLKESDPFARWAGGAQQHLVLLSEAFLRTIPAALMLATLIGIDIGPRQVFIGIGDLGAPARLPLVDRVPWVVAVAPVTALIAMPLLVFLAVVERPDLPRLGQVLMLLPVAFVFAVVNAAQEEIRFRVVPLGRLEPALGPTHALLLSSLLFGIGHWSGRPSGPPGIVLAALAGLLWGRSMLDTRGLLLPWMSHGVQDVLIFMAVAISRR